MILSVNAESSPIIQTHYATGAMAILEHFGFPKFTEVFKRPGGVHQVWNILSLEPNLHFDFDNLNLWFEHTDQVRCSGIC